jgi:hypothetical protein
LRQEDGAFLVRASKDRSKRLLVTVSAISLGKEPASSSNPIHLQFFPEPPSVKGPATFALCTKPFYGQEGLINADLLMQYIEYYKALGASHFTFYNSSPSRASLCLLNHYIEQVIEPGASGPQAIYYL